MYLFTDGEFLLQQLLPEQVSCDWPVMAYNWLCLSANQVLMSNWDQLQTITSWVGFIFRLGEKPRYDQGSTQSLIFVSVLTFIISVFSFIIILFFSQLSTLICRVRQRLILKTLPHFLLCPFPPLAFIHLPAHDTLPLRLSLTLYSPDSPAHPPLQLHLCLRRRLCLLVCMCVCVCGVGRSPDLRKAL